MPQHPPMRRTLLPIDGVEIQSPAGNRHHCASDTLYASGIAGANVVKVWLKVLRRNDNAAIPDPQTAGFVEATLDAGGFYHTAVPGVLTTPLDGNNDNKMVAIPELAAGYGPTDTVYFVGRPAQENLTVSALCCIWFTFAVDGLTGPGPMGDTEANVTQHRPRRFVAPMNAFQLSVSANGTWQHFPQDAASGPDGMLPQTDLELPGYRSGNYLSEMIDNLFTEVNKLIGLWIDAFDTPISSPFPIGAGPFLDIVPEDSQTLALAFHDGKRWHNNSGSVNVAIEWLTIQQGYYRLRGF